MTLTEIKEILNDSCNDIAFTYQNKKGGIFPEVKDSKAIYHCWYDSKETILYSVDEVMNSTFAGGVKFSDIVKATVMDIS